MDPTGNAEPGENDYFCVETSNNPAAKGNERYFADYETAITYAEQKMPRFRCVWISERGEYQTNTGNWRSNWIYFWWTPATGYGEVYGRGTGIPDDRETPTEYHRLAPL